jgi:class 3 adenylate cyclase
MRLRTWLLLLFGSLLVLTGLSLSWLTQRQARNNLQRSLEQQMQKGVRSSFQPATLGYLRVLCHRIVDSPTVAEYRNVFVTLNGPYQMLLEKKTRAEVLQELGTAAPGDGKRWTREDFSPVQTGPDADAWQAWQAMGGLMRDVGPTLFEESEGMLQLLVMTDRQGEPFLLLESHHDGANPSAEDPWKSTPRVAPALQEMLSSAGDEPREGYYQHSDGLVYLVRVQSFPSGGLLVVGHRLDQNFEQRLSTQIVGSDFRVVPNAREDAYTQAAARRPDGRVEVENRPYLVHGEPLPSLTSAQTPVGHLYQFRSLDSVQAYLRSMTQGIAGLSLGALAVGLLGIGLATQPVSAQMARLSEKMKGVGEGALPEDLTPAGPLELREATGAFNQMVNQLRQKEMLAKMVPKQARQAIEHDETVFGRVMARRIRTTILFSDIRGFTSLSERLKPQEVMDLLDIYLSRMTSIIEGEGGDVNEYIGDAILADFEDRPEATGATRAAQAAWKMREALEELRNEKKHPELETMRQGLGIHTGDVVKGEIGSSDRSKFALIGDTVNLAARIQDRSKEGRHSAILVSDDACRDLLGFELDLFGDEAFKGKSGSFRVWEIVRPTLVETREEA